MLANTIHPRTWVGLILLIAARAASAQDWLDSDVFDFPTSPGPVLEEGKSDAPHDWSQVEKATYVEPQPEPDTSEEIVMDDTQEVVVAPPCCMPGSPLLSSVYFRVDNFAWNQSANGNNYIEERGPLFALGWERAFRRIRLRGELFGGQVDFERFLSGATLTAKTDYIGFRGEFERLFEPESWPRSNLIAGLGIRLWNRHLHDAVYTYFGDSRSLDDVDQRWFTLYPYVGIETKKTPHPDWRFYGSARLGFTAFTLVDRSSSAGIYYPTPGILTQLEAGISNDNSSIGLYYDLTTWGAGLEQVSLQTDQAMGFLGIKAALLY